MESAVTAPVSGHIKRVVVQEGMRYRYDSKLASDCLPRRFDQPGRLDCGDCALKERFLANFVYKSMYIRIQIKTQRIIHEQY